MTIVSALTDDRLITAESENIIGGYLLNGELILVRKDGTTLNAGNIRGPQGNTGVVGAVTDSALAAAIAAAHADGAISSTQLQAFLITNTKFVPLAVTSTKIVDAAVTEQKIASGSVDTSHIMDANVTTAKLSDLAVGTSEIADGAISQTDLALSVGGTLRSGAIHYYRLGDLVTVYTTNVGVSTGTDPVLPVGYRPSGQVYAGSSDSGGDYSDRVQVSSSGTLYLGTAVGNIFFNVTYRV